MSLTTDGQVVFDYDTFQQVNFNNPVITVAAPTRLSVKGWFRVTNVHFNLNFDFDHTPFAPVGWSYGTNSDIDSLIDARLLFPAMMNNSVKGLIETNASFYGNTDPVFTFQTDGNWGLTEGQTSILRVTGTVTLDIDHLSTDKEPTALYHIETAPVTYHENATYKKSVIAKNVEAADKLHSLGHLQYVGLLNSPSTSGVFEMDTDGEAIPMIHTNREYGEFLRVRALSMDLNLTLENGDQNGRQVLVYNDGTVPFTVYDKTLAPRQHARFLWVYGEWSSSV